MNCINISNNYRFISSRIVQMYRIMKIETILMRCLAATTSEIFTILRFFRIFAGLKAISQAILVISSLSASPLIAVISSAKVRQAWLISMQIPSLLASSLSAVPLTPIPNNIMPCYSDRNNSIRGISRSSVKRENTIIYIRTDEMVEIASWPMIQDLDFPEERTFKNATTRSLTRSNRSIEAY